MSEMKATLNVRISPDVNMSFTFTALVDSDAEAEQFGDLCARMTSTFVRGYGDAEIPEVEQ